MYSGVTDMPVNTVEGDAFKIKKYVVGLSEFIQDCNTPMTISIQGDWGSGKTSMMNMLQSIMQDKKIQTVWFNTWQFSQFNLGNNLVFAMLNVLIDSLAEKDDIAKKNIKTIMTSVAKGALAAGLSFATGGLANGKDVLDVASEKIADSDYAKEIMALKDSFEDLVAKRLKALQKDRVVIFVDDLDRLQPAKAVELLEVLKLFLDCKNCVFILAVDYEIVTLGVREKYGDSVTEEKGRSFFDKIIQLPFKMPVSNYDINNYVFKTLKGMRMSVEEKHIGQYVELIGCSIGYNPRAMKRLFNIYQLLDNICKKEYSSIKNMEARERILFGTICMQMKYECLYKYLVRNISFVTSKMLQELADDKKLDVIKNNQEFMELIDIGDLDIDVYLKTITRFMRAFNCIVDIDGNKRIDEDELEIMCEAFKISRITSIESVDESSSRFMGLKKFFENKS